MILSAEFGLIDADTPIPDYDAIMTPGRALSHARQARAKLLATLRQHGPFAETFINLGNKYVVALPVLGFKPVVLNRLGQITQAEGGIGSRMQQMKNWLLGS